MGLFSGFRAKFTKDSVAKNAKKDFDKSNVVCLGYKVYSEFQDPPRYLPQNPIEPKPSSTIRTIPVLPESRTNNHSSPAIVNPQTRIITNSNARKPSGKEKPTPPNRIIRREIHITETANVAEEINGTAKLETQRTSDRMYVVGKTSSFNPDLKAEQQPKSILKQKPTIEIIELRNDTITPDENSQYMVSEDSDDDNTLTTPIKSQSSENKIVEVIYDSSNNEGNNGTDGTSDSEMSSINRFAQELPANYLSTSQIYTETESTNISYTQKQSSDSYYNGNYGYSQTTGKIGSTSSFAANIFFGGDEEPEVQRPRRFNLNGMPIDDESRSSAEC
ncbi:unnamed protein product [Ceutorhynchus assimilis]|uniref:Uncharacterized protein n=1 Tax=Ceutorhynchus assimilis TaxID=467358 RepID=A0A9N9MTD1_9CUCU|nr:unnamed protein product [Ceutorhynchus assimilis]